MLCFLFWKDYFVVVILTKFDNGAAKNNIVVKQHTSPTRSIASLLSVEMVAGSGSFESKGVTAIISTF